MIAANTPPAIVKMQEELFAVVRRTQEAAAELKHRRTQHELDQTTAALERRLMACRDELDRRLAVFIDGEHSIENTWRRICDSHADYNAGAFEGELAKVDTLFENHLMHLRAIREQTVFQSLSDLGLAAPHFDEVRGAIERTQGFREQIVDCWPLTAWEFACGFPVDVEEVIYISPTAFLRSMGAVICSAFRHPFSTTYIDLSTGQCVTPADDRQA